MKSVVYNKGRQLPKTLKKLERFKQNLPIECKRHGWHLKWRLHTGNNVQCLHCALIWQRNQRIRNPLRFIFRDAKKHAETHKRDFEISLGDLQEIMKSQENRCAISGVRFDEQNLPSLDRIDSNEGYKKENIQLVLIKINVMKSNLEQKEFIELCRTITENQQP